MHKFLFSTVHNCVTLIVTDRWSSWLTSILCWFRILLTFINLTLSLWNWTSTFIESLRIQRLFHHLCLTTLLYHVPIMLVTGLLLVMRGATPRIICWLSVVSLMSVHWVLYYCRRLNVYLLVSQGGRLQVFILRCLIGVVVGTTVFCSYSSIILHIYYKLILLLLIWYKTKIFFDLNLI